MGKQGSFLFSFVALFGVLGCDSFASNPCGGTPAVGGKADHGSMSPTQNSSGSTSARPCSPSDQNNSASNPAPDQEIPAFTNNGSLAERVAAAASQTLLAQPKICTKEPPKKVKCAEQATRILKSAGVPIQGSWGVNELVTQLKRAGWTTGPCVAGAVKHSAGNKATGRHIGVIGLDGRAVHNSGSKDAQCGILHNGAYPAWDKNPARVSCLVPPQNASTVRSN